MKILAYHPTDIAKGVRLTRPNNDDGRGVGAQCLPDPTDQGNAMLLCCGGTYSNTRQDNVMVNAQYHSRQRSNNQQKDVQVDGPT